MCVGRKGKKSCAALNVPSEAGQGGKQDSLCPGKWGGGGIAEASSTSGKSGKGTSRWETAASKDERERKWNVGDRSLNRRKSPLCVS